MGWSRMIHLVVLSLLWSSNDSNNVTIEADAPGQVQVPAEEPIDELTEFLELHKDKLARLIQADQPQWDLSIALGRVLSLPGYKQENQRETIPFLPRFILLASLGLTMHVQL